MHSRSGQRAASLIEDVDILPGWAEALERYAENGWTLLGLAWRPELAEGTITAEQADATFARMRELLGVTMDVRYCPHAGGPPACWCRKPLPGLGVELIRRHALDPSQCLDIGSGSLDPGFARRLGFRYVDCDDFLAGVG
jgi:histidinol phosphatase-like enzyme